MNTPFHFPMVYKPLKCSDFYGLYLTSYFFILPQYIILEEYNSFCHQKQRHSPWQCFYFKGRASQDSDFPEPTNPGADPFAALATIQQRQRRNRKRWNGKRQNGKWQSRKRQNKMHWQGKWWNSKWRNGKRRNEKQCNG